MPVAEAPAPLLVLPREEALPPDLREKLEAQLRKRDADTAQNQDSGKRPRATSERPRGRSLSPTRMPWQEVLQSRGKGVTVVTGGARLESAVPLGAEAYMRQQALLQGPPARQPTTPESVQSGQVSDVDPEDAPKAASKGFSKRPKLQNPRSPPPKRTRSVPPPGLRPTSAAERARQEDQAAQWRFERELAESKELSLREAAARQRSHVTVKAIPPPVEGGSSASGLQGLGRQQPVTPPKKGAPPVKIGGVPPIMVPPLGTPPPENLVSGKELPFKAPAPVFGGASGYCDSPPESPRWDKVTPAADAAIPRRIPGSTGRLDGGGWGVDKGKAGSLSA